MDDAGDEELRPQEREACENGNDILMREDVSSDVGDAGAVVGVGGHGETVNLEELPSQALVDGQEDLVQGIELLEHELALETELQENAAEEEDGGVPVVLDGVSGLFDARETIESLLSSLVAQLSRDTLIVFE